jgi:hypothetical protein
VHIPKITLSIIEEVSYAIPSFGMKINKCQGQSSARVGNLPNPTFSHGQLYVAISRATSKHGLEDIACVEEGS